MIEVSNLSFLNKIKYPDFNIENGTLTLLCGPSGAGKTSLLKILNGTADRSSGKVIIESKDLDDYDSKELRRLVVLSSQNVFLFPGTIEYNFNKFYEYREQIPITNDEMKKFLELCKVDFPHDKDVDKMSGGEKQRIFLSICISFRSEILFLDEPTSGLDTYNAEEFVKNLKSFLIQENMTVIAVSHDINLFSKYADKVIDLEKKNE